MTERCRENHVLNSNMAFGIQATRLMATHV